MLDYQTVREQSPSNTFAVVHSSEIDEALSPDSRIRIRGKFFFAGEKKFYAKGVTYGAFKPNERGKEYTDLWRIEKDFAMMSDYGFNTVRIPHTTPPPALLDIAGKYNLKVMVGLSAEQFAGYLIDKDK